MFRFRLIPYLINKLLSLIYRFSRRHYIVWRWTARNYNEIFDKIAYLNACSMCHWGENVVPAYGDFLKKNNVAPHYLEFNLKKYPETNKNNYCKAYQIESRVKYGKIKLVGTMLDESSGSTGVPFNWVRSKEELSDIHTFSANYVRMAIREENLITLNAFSMGSWATGINATLSLFKIGAVKSIGPDIDKLLDTLKIYGPKFNYIICGYPPFMKHLCDEMDKRKFPYEEYEMTAITGGEGMTETLRDYLAKKFSKVRSGYGATDLQLGVGGETSFTIWLRKEILNKNSLKEKILGEREIRIPMIFHYNPLDHYVEVNDNKEIVVTINNYALMSPRLRYNIEDEGRIIKMKQMISILKQEGYDWEKLKREFRQDVVNLPLLFIFGRKDGTISYMGANIYPQDIEYGLYENKYASSINTFCLSLDEHKNLEVRPVVNIELMQDIKINKEVESQMVEAFRKGIINFLSKVDRDFAQARKEDSTTDEMQIKIYNFGDGIFANKDTKRIKNKYLIKV